MRYSQPKVLLIVSALVTSFLLPSRVFSQPLCFDIHPHCPGVSPSNPFKTSPRSVPPCLFGKSNLPLKSFPCHTSEESACKSFASPSAAFTLSVPKHSKHASVTPLFATLTHSRSPKSFACHSYENTRDGGANGAVSDASPLLQFAASAGGLRVKLGEPCFASRQGRFFFAEREAHLVRAVARVVVEAGTRNGGDADFFDQIFRERDVLRSCGETNRVRIGKARNVRHDVIRAARLEHRETGVLQNFQQPRALLRIASRKFVVVTLWRMQCDRAGLLQRSGRAHGKEIVDFANRRCRFRRSDGPADAPAGDAIGLEHAVDHDGALAHAIDARHGDVLRAVIQNVLVNFIGDAERVPAHAKIANEFQLRTREHF